MPRKKKQFINRKTATDFRLLVRSHQDKFADDASAPQHVLQDVSKKRQERKYGIYFDDNYDYMQHLRPSANCPEEDSDDDSEVCEEMSEGDKSQEVSDVQAELSLAKESGAVDFALPEELMGFDDPMFEGRIIEREDDIDPDLLEAMKRAEEESGVRISDLEEGEVEEEDNDLEDDFVCMAAGDGDDGLQEPGPTGPLLSHFFDTLGGDASDLKLAMYGDSDDDSETGDVAEQLKAERLRAEREGRAPEDYHSQCLQLQIEKIVEDAVTYDIDEVRSHLSGMSCAMTESMRQAMATDERHRLQSVIYRPEETMTEAERNEHNARTLSMIAEEAASSGKDEEEEDDDPVETWVNFDRRCKISSTVDDPRDGYVPVASAVSCTVQLPSSSSRPQQRARHVHEDREDECPSPQEMSDPDGERNPNFVRKKNETAEEKRARKTAVRNAQRERRAVKKQNRTAFKTESSRQAASGKPSTLLRV